MDDTTQGKSEAAAATRKRRSSILKAARQSRAPLSELEFNAPTPPADAKGRRVSFSRRNNVAEFVTNEATTTWKNLYEEHNRTLESSGNESAERPRLQQLGGRLIDQQFQEVIAIDFGENRGLNMDSSVSQIALGNLECTTDDKNLLPPQHKFEVSAFTDQQSKLFADDLAISGMGELTDKISFNFSSMQPLSDKNDDLEQMENDLLNQSNRANVVCQGPNMGNLSEYIEVDLNMTRITTPNEQSDMSITDTIQSPVQNVSKNANSVSNEKPGEDWVVDKENIVLNPYIAPKESDNFAVNEEPGKVLVFDGKRLTIQSDKDLNSKIGPAVTEDKKTQRKTIVLNMNDDLPNFVDDVNSAQLPNFAENESLLQTPKGGLNSKPRAGNDSALTTTQLLSHMLDMTEPELEPKHGRDDTVTQAKPCDISMTQAVPATIILADKSEKIKTIVYQTNAGNISVTQPVPSLISPDSEPLNERRKTILYEDEAGNVSITQAVTSHIFLPSDTNKDQDKRRTIVFETNSGDISITQAVPTNLIMPENKIVYDSDSGNFSVSKSLPNDQILREASERRRTVLYADETGNISMTQAISNNMFIEHVQHVDSSQQNRRGTTVFENDFADISTTQVVARNSILSQLPEEPVLSKDYIKITDSSASSSNTQMDARDKRKTIVFDADAANLSMTQAIPSNILADRTESQKRQTIVFENDAGDISITRPITSNMILESDTVFAVHNRNAPKENVATEILTNSHEGDADMFITVAAAGNQDLSNNLPEFDEINMELTEAVRAHVLLPPIQETMLERNETPLTPSVDSLTTNPVNQTNSEDADVSVTQGSDESKDMLNISSRAFGNHSLHTELTSNNSSIDLISDKKKEILENCLKMVSLSKKSTKTPPIRPKARHMIDTVIYQTVTDNAPRIKPKPIEFSAEINAEEINELGDKSSPIAPIIDMDTADQVEQDLVKIKNAEDEREQKEESEIKTVALKTSCETISSDLSKIERDLKNALLCDLLDMSNANVDIQGDGYDDKSVTAKIESANLPVAPAESPKSLEHAASGESFFFIKDEDDGIQNSDEEKTSKPRLDVRLPLQIEFKKPENDIIFPSIPTKPEPVTITVKRSPTGNRYFEDIRSPDLESSWHNKRRSVKDADNTKELLEMLANFTDKEEEENPIQPLKVKGPLALEMKNEVPERRHNSPRRQSMAFSREDLLNNISMAQSMLQKSQMANDSTLNETHDSILEDCHSPKAVQVPGDVVKTLRFEEESLSDSSVQIEVTSPLKKTAFGESAYMKENKGNVIPGYLKDVSDGLKQLMNDLVKPMADNSFGEDNEVLDREPSTCSMQVEANLITSSQIDIDVEAGSDGTSVGHRIRKGIIKPFTPLPTPKGAADDARCSPVIVFDHDNPLNNVLLAPIDFSSAHRYHPPSQESIVKQSPQVKDSKEAHGTAQFNVEACVQQQFTHIPGGDAAVENLSQVQSRSSILSKNGSTSIDVEIDAPAVKLKNSEANTIIAMKGNKQLLRLSSSLTLINDNEESTSSTGETNSLYQKRSPVKVLYYTAESVNTVLGTVEEETKPKKRLYSPNKKKNLPVTNLETTPKQNSKIRKISKSPNETKTPTRLSSHASPDHIKERKSKSPTYTQNTTSPEKQKSPSIKPSPTKKAKCKRPGTQITVQQLITEYHAASGLDALRDSGDVLEILKRQSNSSSSTEGVATLQPAVETSSLLSTTNSVPRTESAFKQGHSPMDWQPELINELSSKNLLMNCDSGVDVLAKIDVLPFMGSEECEWEVLNGRAWSFVLLRGRLRLALRMARVPVRADTPIDHVAIEAITQESEAIPSLCVGYALEAMRFASRRLTHARDVPAVLRRCAGISRVAARWALAMRSARIRLAFNIKPDGHVTLKVANVPLRSVWEVSLQLAMSAEGREAPCPRATGLTVSTVVGEPAPAKEVARAFQGAPADWGHAPNVIWKVFKYLKNKPANTVM